MSAAVKVGQKISLPGLLRGLVGDEPLELEVTQVFKSGPIKVRASYLGVELGHGVVTEASGAPVLYLGTYADEMLRPAAKKNGGAAND